MTSARSYYEIFRQQGCKFELRMDTKMVYQAIEVAYYSFQSRDSRSGTNDSAISIKTAKPWF